MERHLGDVKLRKTALNQWYGLYKTFSNNSLDQWYHHHHQVPDLEQTLAAMPLQTSLSSDNFKKFKPLLCPPVAELQRLSRNVIRCLPLSRLPSTLPVKDKNFGFVMVFLGWYNNGFPLPTVGLCTVYSASLCQSNDCPQGIDCIKPFLTIP